MNYDRQIFCQTPEFDHYSVYRKKGNDFVLCDGKAETLDDVWIVGTPDEAPQSFTVDNNHVKSSDWVYRDGKNVRLTVSKTFALNDDGTITERGIVPSSAALEIGRFARMIRESPSPVDDILTYCHKNGMPTFSVLGGKGKEWQGSHIGFCVGDLISDLGNLQEWIEAAELNGSEDRESAKLDLRRSRREGISYADMRLVLYYKDNWPRMKRVCGDLIHAARIGIFYNTIDSAERPIRECRSCHELFEKTKKHQLYCDFCGTKANQQARWRAKNTQKDMTTNGGGDNGKKAR